MASIKPLPVEPNHACPRRMNEIGPWQHQPDLDTWTTGRGVVGIQDEQPSCSFCGSLHPGTFMQWLRDGGPIGATSKNYKAYIDCPYPNERYGETTDEIITVDGGGSYRSISVYGRTAKFYFQHLDADQQREFVDLYNAGHTEFSGGQGFEIYPYFMRPAA